MWKLYNNTSEFFQDKLYSSQNRFVILSKNAKPSCSYSRNVIMILWEQTGDRPGAFGSHKGDGLERIARNVKEGKETCLYAFLCHRQVKMLFALRSEKDEELHRTLHNSWQIGNPRGKHDGFKEGPFQPDPAELKLTHNRRTRVKFEITSYIKSTL